MTQPTTPTARPTTITDPGDELYVADCGHLVTETVSTLCVWDLVCVACADEHFRGGCPVCLTN